MLQTINGFDLVLIITITGLIIRNRHLNRECLSYVEQILKVSWEPAFIPDPCDFCTDSKPIEIYPTCTCKEPKCLYCEGIEEFVTGNECYCDSL